MSTKRKANWVSVEIECLAEECTVNYGALFGKFDHNHTASKREALWADIAEKINSTSTNVRTSDEVQKKWKDLKSSTKKKEQERRRRMRATGGGSQEEDLKDWEDKIINAIPIVTIEGVSGGMDSFQGKQKIVTIKDDDEVNTETVFGDEILVHPKNVIVEVKTDLNLDTTQETIPTNKRRKTDLEWAQLKYFQEETITSQERRKTLIQKRKTLEEQEVFYKLACEKLRNSETSYVSEFLRTLNEH